MDNKATISFTPVKTQRASDVIYQQIYKKIADGELKTGDKLPSERELCEMFERSRPSVREALRMLQQDGLITITVGTNGGSTVNGVLLDSVEQPLRKLIGAGTISVEELIEYRDYNDHCCANLATKNRTENDIKRIQDIIEQYRDSVANPEKLKEIDIQFHNILAESSHNKLCILITSVVTSLCAEMFWNIAVTDVPPEELTQFNQIVYEKHLAIANAVIAGDTDNMKKNMSTVANMFYSAMDGYIEDYITKAQE